MYASGASVHTSLRGLRHTRAGAARQSHASTTWPAPRASLRATLVRCWRNSASEEQG